MGSLEPLLLRACRREKVERTPVWFMRQAGRYLEEYRALRRRYSMLEMCRTPELAAEVTLQPLRRFSLDAAIIFADILLPLPPLGVPFHFAAGEGPRIDEPIRTVEAVNALHPFDPEEELGYVLEALRLVRAELPEGVALIGFAGAPFTLASYMIEGGHSRHFTWTRRLMYEAPEAWDRLLSLLAEVTIEYLAAQVRAGAQVVQLFDSWVGALDPEDYRRYVQPYTKRILDGIAALGAPRIHFGTGTAGILEAVRDAGGDVIGVDWRIPLGQAWARIGYDRAVQGNLDPVALLAPPEVLKRKVEWILEEAGGRPGHVFNLGHGILPETPPENVAAVVEWVREYRSGS
ncbi:MAG: uroporphyrinogen decarboxylase [Acidobacteriota bacterium]